MPRSPLSYGPREQRAFAAQAAVERLLENGRCMVYGGSLVEAVVELANDAEVEVQVTSRAQGGWWIELLESK